MKVGLRLNGKAIGIDPTPAVGKSGDDQFPVYANRDAVGAWEEGELTAHDGGQFDFRFLSSNRQLTITPDGKLASRAAGTFGPWELNYATDQPDGSSLFYRVEGQSVPVLLTIEAKS